MIPLELGELADLLSATRVDWPTDHDRTAVSGVATDSREVEPGDVFLARSGERLDGLRFAADAVGAGAVAVVASRRPATGSETGSGTPTLLVEDPQAALVGIARAVRDRSRAVVVGVTGSVGKTTTKDFLAAVAGATVSTVAARGSFNNEVGVPLTVCRVTEDTRLLVTELGARGRGHIADLAGWLRPDVAIVTVVAGAHLELFRDLDEVAIAKRELVESLRPDGIAVLNVDDPRVAAMADRAPGRVQRVSVHDPGADVHARDVVLDEWSRASFTAVTAEGEVAVSLPIAGRHHVSNALLALAAARAAGLDALAGAAALATAEVSRGRGALVTAASGVVVVDDAYNANPTSVLAALDALADHAADGRRIAVLGVMAEIGATHEADHRRVGAAAAAVVDRLVVVGDDAGGLATGARDAAADVEVVVVGDVASAHAALDDVTAGDTVLVKASRVAGLDRLVDLLVEDPAVATRNGEGGR